MAARTVTRAYDNALRPTGLRATQISVLAAVAASDAVSITELAEKMGMDRTTLKRNLTPLEQLGLLAVGNEGWRRSRTVAITAMGRTRLQDAIPLWESAQRRLKQQLGSQRWADVQTTLQHLIDTASE